MTLKRLLLQTTVSNILKAKESPCVTFERKKRVSQSEFTEQDL